MSAINIVTAPIIIRHPINSYISKYRFETIIVDALKPKRVIESSVVKDVEIIFIGKYNGLYRYQVLCFNTVFESNVSIEGESIVRRTGYIFDELKLSANAEGVIIKLHNLHDIQERWHKTRDELLKDNKGEALEAYISEISALIADEKTLIAYLKDYQMLGMYFNGWLGKYEVNKPPKKKPQQFLKNTIIEETVNAKLAEEIIEVAISGELAEQSTTPEIKKDVPLKNMETHYSGIALYKDNFLVESFIEIRQHHRTIKHAALWVG